jgi:hypothetical protein
VLDAGGRMLARADFNSLDQLGATFRARSTADHFVRVVDQSASAEYAPDAVWIAIDADCAAARRTLCTLPVGTTRSGKLFNYKGDVDWYGTALEGGRSYAVRAQLVSSGEFVRLRLRDAAGRILTPWACSDYTVNGACDATFRAPAGATYYVEAEWTGEESSARYAISLSAR